MLREKLKYAQDSAGKTMGTDPPGTLQQMLGSSSRRSGAWQGQEQVIFSQELRDPGQALGPVCQYVKNPKRCLNQRRDPARGRAVRRLLRRTPKFRPSMGWIRRAAGEPRPPAECSLARASLRLPLPAALSQKVSCNGFIRPLPERASHAEAARASGFLEPLRSGPIERFPSQPSLLLLAQSLWLTPASASC